MAATSPRETRRSGDTFRLRWDVFESLAKARGAHTADEQAALIGCHRATLFRIKRGDHEPSVGFIANTTSALGKPIEVLFERVKDAA